MQLGQYQLQVFVSLVVVLCAACITVICEFIKNREQAQAEEKAIKHDPRHRTGEKRKRPKRTTAPEAIAAMERGMQRAITASAPAPEAPAVPKVVAPEPIPEPVLVTTAEPAPVPVFVPKPEPVEVLQAAIYSLELASEPESEPAPARRDWGGLLKASKTVQQQEQPAPKKRLAIPLRPLRPAQNHPAEESAQNALAGMQETR